jgi:hypothetical protein
MARVIRHLSYLGVDAVDESITILYHYHPDYVESRQSLGSYKEGIKITEDAHRID